ncbi:MAG: ETC complex I subunit [Alphaproteobacteria bacterium]|jgi:hypothetical protein|nr:ETC complex I subunit [Alphaproteobacteria bacterium]MBT5389207.1 ETC complex I subunit [Alphaproteobacteria bacterium]
MRRVRIYKPSKTATQSGKFNERQWRLEFEPESAQWTDPLMGWTGSKDMRQEIKLKFDNLEEAIAYAKSQGFSYTVEQPNLRKVEPKSYSDNFC